MLEIMDDFVLGETLTTNYGLSGTLVSFSILNLKYDPDRFPQCGGDVVLNLDTGEGCVAVPPSCIVIDGDEPLTKAH